MADIFLGITGGIAAYKMPEMIRMMQKKGHTVRAGMTSSAAHFVTPLTLQTITGQKVMLDQFELPEEWNVEHIDSAKWMDLFIVCPATANMVGKFANGIADDFLSTLFLAVKSPVLVCPAMNSAMYSHPVVVENIKKLKDLNVNVIEPEDGYLACGDEGKGRLASLDSIVAEIERYFAVESRLKGKKIVVTAGPTCEDIDPVRFLTNRSTGKMGYAIAAEAVKRNADVTLISGPVDLEIPAGAKSLGIRSAEEMRSAVLDEVSDADILIMSAAVADYRPEKKMSSKIKKSGIMQLELVGTEDILAGLAERKIKPFLVGFAAESENLEVNAIKKLKSKKMDLIVANDISRDDIGFASQKNEVTVFGENFREELTLSLKTEIAEELLNIIEKRM